jgi:hypothetical protein
LNQLIKTPKLIFEIGAAIYRGQLDTQHNDTHCNGPTCVT